MQTIHSGTTTERLLRTLLLMVLVDGFTAAYLWDGYVGYARQNGRELVRLLGLPADTDPATLANLSAEEGRNIAATVKAGEELTAVTAKLGPPSLLHGNDAYFLGPGGWLKVQKSGERIAGAAWTDGPKTESDQKWQRWIGFALAGFGVLIMIRLVVVASARLVLSDAGLEVGGRPVIPFAAMSALRPDPAGRAACVELEYSLRGASHRVRLDGYVYKKLPEIVAAICERKGYANPWPGAKAVGGG